VLLGALTVESAGGGSVLRFTVEESHQSVNRPAFVILLLGALGAGTVVLWPLYPPLLSFAPVGVVLALAAWLLVASRLRTSGPEDFLKLVAAIGQEGPADLES
jgi:membrane protein implicated in regulation of membrane protease activity